MRLPGGRTITFFAVHPTPPIPSSKYPDGVGERSIALGQIASFVRQQQQPAIVAGDFNDVPWSGTTHKLSRGGTLLDTRRGRGFYATFDVNSRLMRWPLDQFFVTPQFRVVSLRRLPDVGSDHFPIVAEFVLTADSAGHRGRLSVWIFAERKGRPEHRPLRPSRPLEGVGIHDEYA